MSIDPIDPTEPKPSSAVQRARERAAARRLTTLEENPEFSKRPQREPDPEYLHKVLSYKNVIPDLQVADESQVAALALVLQDLDETRTAELTGAAGCGKTWVVRLLGEILQRGGNTVQWAATTGKAALRLRQRVEGVGLPPETVHRLIYGQAVELGKCPFCGYEDELLGQPKLERVEFWAPEPDQCPSCGRRLPEGLVLDNRLEWHPSPDLDNCSGIVVDEASMMGKAVFEDFQAVCRERGIFYVMVGDPYQLPPVPEGDERQSGTVACPALEHPSAELLTVHRQEKGSAILDFATTVRKYRPRSPWDLASNAKGLTLSRRGSVEEVARWLADRLGDGGVPDSVLLCHQNRTRRTINDRVVEMLGLDQDPDGEDRRVFKGHRLVCTANNRGAGVLNGELFTVLGSRWFQPTPAVPATHVFLHVHLVSDEGKHRHAIIVPSCVGVEDKNNERFKSLKIEVNRVWGRVTKAWKGSSALQREVPTLEAFAKMQGLLDPRQMMQVDWGYCLTGHKSQGSQWPFVGVIWEMDWLLDREPDMTKRWLYTAVTRAETELFLWGM